MTDASIIAFISLAGVVLAGSIATAQPENADSLAMERRIAIAASDVTFPEGARALLLGRLQQGMREDALQIIRFMDRRIGYAPSPWLSARERLMVTTITTPLPLVRDSAELEGMLRRWNNSPPSSSPFSDTFHDRLRELLRQSAGDLSGMLQELGASEIELRFVELLLNHQTTRGYRARMTLNSRVDAFAAAFPEQRLARLAQDHLTTIYTQSQFGAAFTAGYTIGRPAGRLAETFDLFWAPSLAGELNYGPATLTGSLLIGAIEAPSDFTAGGAIWQRGETALLTWELTAGYEVRSGRLGLTPSLGMVVQSASGAHSAESVEPPRTGTHTGWVGHLGIGYRIPSDVGPHFDFRLRIGHIDSGLDSYDSVFDGSITYLQIGFALVQRPWEEGP